MSERLLAFALSPTIEGRRDHLAVDASSTKMAGMARMSFVAWLLVSSESGSQTTASESTILAGSFSV
jgi:hypothetical protein